MKTLLEETLDQNGDILYLHAAFVARTFYPALGRLGLRDFSAGSRGWYSERWLASCVQADNADFLEGEGMSRVELCDGSTMRLVDVLAEKSSQLLGEAYSRRTGGRFGVLSKLLDIGLPIPWHIHPADPDARRYWNSRGKEEAYYFLETSERGPFPYSHLGVHPDVGPSDVLPLLQRWNDDSVLDLSPAYRLNVGEGFHIRPGVPHAPGTALTLEVQEESDVYNFLQAVSEGRLLDKSLCLRGLPDERAVLGLIDWETSRLSAFYRAFHTRPVVTAETPQMREAWIFHPNRTPKFSGKEVRLAPAASTLSAEGKPFCLFIWKGKGEINGIPFEAGNPSRDELFVGVRAATQPHTLHNTGDEELVVYKLFGPDVSSGTTATTSISTVIPSGNPPTETVVRAGGGVPNWAKKDL